MAISKGAVKRLKETFLNQNVIIHLKDMNIVSANEAGETVEITGMVDGHVLDIDEDFYYLGTIDGIVMRTVSHDVAQIVEILLDADDMIMSEMINMDGEVH